MENNIEIFNEIIEGHDGHRDRLRQRLLYQGVDALENHEMLEFLLYYVIPRQNVNALAHALVDHFGNLREVFTADMSSLLQVEGVGETVAEWIYTLGKFAAACGALRPRNDIILDNYRRMFSYARCMAREYQAPCCMQLLMDYRGKLIYRNIAHIVPDRNKTAFLPVLQEFISDAITLNAKCTALVILVGKRVSYPSGYDRSIARKYARMLNSAGISLMDAVVCGSTGIASLRRLNMIPENLKRSPRNSLREGYISSLRPARLKGGRYRFYSNRGGNYERIEPV